MRKIIVGAFTSLDGVMQAPGGPDEDPSGGFRHGGWAFPFFDEDMAKAVDELFAKPFDLLLGRKTYDIFAAHWPYAPEDDPIGSLFDRITKYVATRDPGMTLSWQNSRTLGEDVVGTIKELKAEEGPNLLTQGSTDFLQTLFRHGLVDEMYVSVFPVILGGGKRLFSDGGAPVTMKLLSSKTSGSGIVVNRYVTAGPVVTGTFEFDQPTEAELERRRKLS
jgi:dihydrofolate reductase